MSAVLRVLRRHPVTPALTVLIAGIGVAALVTGSRGPFTLESIGLDTAGIRARHWWLIATSLLPLGGVVQLVVAVLACAAGVGVAERLMGSRRTIAAFLITGVVGSGTGVLLELLGAHLGEFWSRAVSELDTADPLTPIAGTLAWATAWAPPLWRRRLRAGLVAIAASLLLYSGQPADLYLLVAVLAGLGAGRLLRPPGRRTRASSRETRGMLALVAVSLAAGPLLTVVSGTRYGALSPLGVALLGQAPSGRQACRALDPGSGCLAALTVHRLETPSGLLVAVLPVVLELVGAVGLATGRRAAVWLVAVLSLVSGVAAAWYLGVAPLVGAPRAVGVRPGHEWEFTLWLLASTAIPTTFAALLLALRRAFPVRLPRRRIAVAVVVAGAGVVVVPLLCLVIGLLDPHGFLLAATPARLLISIADRLTPAPLLRHVLPALVPVDPLARAALWSTGPIAWASLIAAAVVLVGGRRETAAGAEAPGLRALLAVRSGTLGHMTTWPGVRVWTDPSGTAGVPFRLVDGCAITVSDPVGRAGDPDALLDGFLRHCDARAWIPVFYSVHDTWARALRDRGWWSVQVAEEAVIDPAAFGLGGKAMQEVRTSVNRAPRLGLRTVWGTWRALPRPVARQVVALSEEWIAMHELPELGFTLGGIDELDDAEVEVGVVVDAEGRVLAVTSWLPVTDGGRLTGRTLDVMRRRPDAPNGVMELLIADQVARAAAEGLGVVSLSASPLARSGPGEGPLDAILQALGGALEPAYGFRSLQRFKRKFQPTSQPLSLVVRDPLTLPRAGLAIARAYLPGLGLREVRALRAAR